MAVGTGRRRVVVREHWIGGKVTTSRPLMRKVDKKTEMRQGTLTTPPLPALYPRSATPLQTPTEVRGLDRSSGGPLGGRTRRPLIG